MFAEYLEKSRKTNNYTTFRFEKFDRMQFVDFDPKPFLIFEYWTQRVEKQATFDRNRATASIYERAEVSFAWTDDCLKS